MSEKKIKWHKIADNITELVFEKNDISVIDVNGKKMCLARYKDQYFSFAYKCPHAGGFLADGHIDVTGNVVCPVHRYKFSMMNGRNVSGEGYYLKRWSVEVREDGVFVGLEDGSLFGWF